MQLNDTSGQGKANELLLLLDYQEDLSLNPPRLGSTVSSAIGSLLSTLEHVTVETLNIDSVEEVGEEEVKVQIGTLSPFKGFGVATCKMSVVKRMTAKPDFLKMPFKDRKCEVELYEDCRTRKLLEECGCVPWEVPDKKVKFNYRIL